MDELDVLKKDWQKEDKEFPVLSYNELYKMILKKSSSIVKWIFIISILELVFWLFISFIVKATSDKDISGIESNTVFIIFSIISYGVLAYFFYRFYINYKNINTTDSAAMLMKNIIKTRRTVKHYVTFNLVSIVVSVLVLLPIIMNKDPRTRTIIENASANGELFKYYAKLILGTLLTLSIFIAVILVFYWLIYGILLKRLNNNYKELKKLEL